jgi:hypothetical protein
VPIINGSAVISVPQGWQPGGIAVRKLLKAYKAGGGSTMDQGSSPWLLSSYVGAVIIIGLIITAGSISMWWLSGGDGAASSPSEIGEPR